MDSIKMTGVNYWKWRTYVCDIWINEEKQKNAELQLKLMAKDVELMQVKMALYRKQVVELSVEKVSLSKKNYAELSAEIEKELGTTLKGKVVDDVTYEIKELEGDNT